MAASVQGVRDKVDGILADLDRTHEEARAAAAGRRRPVPAARRGRCPIDQDATGRRGGAADRTPRPQSAGSSRVATRVKTWAGPPARPRSTSSSHASGRGPTTCRSRRGAARATQRRRCGRPVGTPDDGRRRGRSGRRRRRSEAEAAPGPDDELIARRDALLAPVTARLSRTVKRALGDDQNRLLDQLRNAPSLTAPTSSLAPRTSTWPSFAAAARGQLAEAFAAGTVFAGAGAAAVPKGDAVEQSSSALARMVVTMLRRQIAEGSGEPGDRVGAAFREWRGERVERLAGDYAHAGVLGGGGGGRRRRASCAGLSPPPTGAPTARTTRWPVR